MTTDVQHPPMLRTRIRVQRSDGREWPTMAIAYRELIGTAQELGSGEHARIRSTLRSGAPAVDRHGFTWKAFGGVVSEQTIAWTDFTFGVELEILVQRTEQQMRQLLVREGFSNWSVVHDGSLSAEANYWAMEIVSPVLQGVAGLEETRRIADLIKANGGRVNASCGLHVHIGVRGMKISRLRKIAIAFLNAEHCFDRLVPPARNRNRYCQSNVRRSAGHSIGGLVEAGSVRAIADHMNGGNSSSRYNPYRYYKLNFQSFIQHGTIEFRQHNGSVDSTKICSWIRLIAGFCAHGASAEQQAVNAPMTFDRFLEVSTDTAGREYMAQRAAKFAAAAARRAA